MRAVTRNINFPVVDIFHPRSKDPLPLRIAVASPRYTITFNINAFSKNSKAYNLLMAEEHVSYTWYTGKTDGEGSRSQEYLTQFHTREDSTPSPISIKQGLRTTDYGLRTTDYGLRTTDYGLRTTDYGLDIKHGLRYKTRTKHYGMDIKYELGIKHGLGYKEAHTGCKLHCLLSV